MRAPSPRPTVLVATVALLGSITVLAAPAAGASAPTPVCSGGICRVTFTATDEASAGTTFVVPAEVKRVDLLVKGAGGGTAGQARGGAGAINTNAILVAPDDELTIVVGRAGTVLGGPSAGGGGAAGSAPDGSVAVAASGGGGSFVYRGESPVSIAAGGGGGADDGTVVADGGNAGIHERSAAPGTGPDGTTPPTGASDLTPGAGGSNGDNHGADGAASTPQAPVGAGGNGADVPVDSDAAPGGGGGGGYAGGGGGAPSQSGAGGSSYYVSDLGGSSETDSLGNTGDGSVTVSYVDPQVVTGTTLEVSPISDDLTTADPIALTAKVSAEHGSPEGSVTFRDLVEDVPLTGCVAVPLENGAAHCDVASLREAGGHQVRADFTSTSGLLDSQSPLLSYYVTAVPTILTTTLPDGTYGTTYAQTLSADGSTAPYTFALTGAGKLPAGLTLHADGAVDGVPTAASDRPSTITVTVTDSQSPPRSTSRQYVLSVAKAGAGQPDFVLTPDHPVVGGSYPVTSTPGASSAPLVLTGNDNCRVDGSTVRFLHVGTCEVTGTQDGDANHEVADPVVKTVSVGPGTPPVGVTVSTGTSAVYGQPATATATVAVPGTVSFAVDGVPFGSPTPVANGTASVSLPLLTVGRHAVTAAFTPAADVTDWTTSDGTARTVTVTAAASSTTVALTPTELRATVVVSAPSTATPSGTVTFAVDGSTVGTAEVTAGTATLAYALPTGVGHTVTASYGGHRTDGTLDIAPSTGTGSRIDPAITAALTSTSTKSSAGWYRAPVTVTFSCATGSAVLVSCPGPTTVTTDGAQSVTGTVEAADGGRASVTVPVAIDRTAPVAPTIRGVVAGRIYPGAIPTATCVATDATSGVVSCTVVRTVKDIAITYTATAVDRAGNVSRTVVTAARSIVLISGADYRGAAPVVHGGRKYALVVTGAARPSVVVPTLAPARPTKVGAAFAKAGVNRWTLALVFPKANAKRPMWNLGIRIGAVTTVVPVKVVR